MAWSKSARLLLLGVRLGALRFFDGRWHWIDMTGRMHPSSRREAVGIAESYANAEDMARVSR